MAQLLVSVRNPAEAALAAAAGVDIVDLKEPADGSLGAVSSAVRQGVLKQFPEGTAAGARPRLSVALGELTECLGEPVRSERLVGLDAFDFAKVGLAGALRLNDWRNDWLELIRSFPATTRPVAAAYADAGPAEAPQPEELLELAIEWRLSVFLLDTWSKSSGNVFQVLSQSRLDNLRRRADGRLCFALAGSLDVQCEGQLGRLRPDIVALRGAVCVAGRTSELSTERLADWSARISRLSASHPAIA